MTVIIIIIIIIIIWASLMLSLVLLNTHRRVLKKFPLGEGGFVGKR